MRGKLWDIDSSKKLAINDRGQQKVLFGYNNSGDEVEFVNFGNIPFSINNINKVFIKVYDNTNL